MNKYTDLQRGGDIIKIIRETDLQKQLSLEIEDSRKEILQIINNYYKGTRNIYLVEVTDGVLDVVFRKPGSLISIRLLKILFLIEHTSSFDDEALENLIKNRGE